MVPSTIYNVKYEIWAGSVVGVAMVCFDPLECNIEKYLFDFFYLFLGVVHDAGKALQLQSF